MKKLNYCGHQGDLCIRRIFQKSDGTYYVMVLDREESIKKNKRVYKEEMYNLTGSLKKSIDNHKKKLVPDTSVKFLTVLRGEHTGHHHGFHGNAAIDVFKSHEDNHVNYLYGKTVANDVVLEHFNVRSLQPTREHDPIQLPQKSIFEFRTQRMLDFNGVIMPVVD